MRCPSDFNRLNSKFWSELNRKFGICCTICKSCSIFSSSSFWQAFSAKLVTLFQLIWHPFDKIKSLVKTKQIIVMERKWMMSERGANSGGFDADQLTNMQSYETFFILYKRWKALNVNHYSFYWSGFIIMILSLFRMTFERQDC